MDISIRKGQSKCLILRSKRYKFFFFSSLGLSRVRIQQINITQWMHENIVTDQIVKFLDSLQNFLSYNNFHTIISWFYM